MKNFRLALIGKESCLFRILLKGKKTKFNHTRHAVWNKILKKKKDFYAIFRCTDFLCYFYAVFCLIFI